MQTLKELLLNRVLQENSENNGGFFSLQKKIEKFLEENKLGFEHCAIAEYEPKKCVLDIRSMEAAKKIAEANELGNEIYFPLIQKKAFGTNSLRGYNCYCFCDMDKKVFITFNHFNTIHFLYGEKPSDYELSFENLPKNMQKLINYEHFKKFYRMYCIEYVKNILHYPHPDMNYNIEYVNGEEECYMVRATSLEFALHQIEKNNLGPLDSLDGKLYSVKRLLEFTKKTWKQFEMFFGVYKTQPFMLLIDPDQFFIYRVYTCSKCMKSNERMADFLKNPKVAKMRKAAIHIIMNKFFNRLEDYL